MKNTYYIIIFLSLLLGMSNKAYSCKELSISCSNDIDLGCVVPNSYVEFNSSIHSSLFHVEGQRYLFVCTEVYSETEQSGVTIDLDWEIKYRKHYPFMPLTCSAYPLMMGNCLTGKLCIKMTVKSLSVEPDATPGDYSFVQTVEVQYMGI